jgi:dihydrolipoamide dehydrogenase
MHTYDILIIGSGPGGYVAAIRASQLGFKVAIVEKESLGGVCLNWGCIPTKALLKSAQVFEYTKQAAYYGIKVNDLEVDFDTMIQRSRNVAEDMSTGIAYLMKKNKIDVIIGTATLKSKNSILVNFPDNSAKEYSAKHIILATGARSRELPNMVINHKTILGYRDVLALKAQPKSMLIVGAGAIGVEFAYFYNSIGTQVTLVEFMPNILPLEDDDISKEIAKQLIKQGIAVHTDTEVTKIENIGNKCLASLKGKTDTSTKECDVVLSAVGITSNIENLGIDILGIAIEKGKIVVDKYYKTAADNVYAIGDIVPGPALAHVASAEGIICVEAIAGLNPEPLDYKNMPSCTYCSPEVASVGYTEKAAIEAGYAIKVGKFPFSASGKAATSGHKEGFVKVIFDKKYGEWLGAHIIGANATELISEVVVARKLETTAYEILKSVHPHPTMSEAIIEAVAVAYDECIHL